MQLHILNRSPSHSSWQEACLAISQQDAVVLMQEACYALLESKLLSLLQAKGAICFIMQDDIKLRGIPDVPPGVNILTSEQLVLLSLQAHHCISWY